MEEDNLKRKELERTFKEEQILLRRKTLGPILVHLKKEETSEIITFSIITHIAGTESEKQHESKTNDLSKKFNRMNNANK